ncbi:hypothetical protein [Desulfocurvus vexinensis]|uniref:hypothetical protein n=1 Tax=Desulfocurvus vexinensis TaxID=399548 RepID=UPI0004B64B04|nr:hypothetical protein [Desulfocurvus vexinensis]
MADDKGVTHQELARAAGVSVTTVKGYRDKFPGCFPVLREGKPLRFAAQSLDACVAIRQGFADGLSVEQLRERLRLRFPWSWRHPLPEKPVISADLQRTVQDLARTVVRLTRAQAEATQRLERLERALGEAPPARGGAGAQGPGPQAAAGESRDREQALDALRRDVREGLARQGAALEALQGQVRALERGPASAGGEGERVVRIRSASGAAERYALRRLPPEDEAPGAGGAGPGREAAPGQDAASAPGAAVLGLPLTVRSGKGEFLGVAGPGGHLTVRGFAALVARSLGLASEAVAWSGGPGGWRLDLGTSPAHSLDFSETTTPRGNHVALVQGMRIDGQPQDADALVALLRTLRQQYAED